MDLSTRQAVKDALTLEIRRLETEIVSQTKNGSFSVEPSKAPGVPSSRCYDVKLTNYGK